MISHRRLVRLASLVFCMFAVAVHAELDKYELERESFAMSPADAAALVARLPSGPDEIAARFKLLMYYWWNQAPAEAAPHYLWFVEKHPGSELLDGLVFSLEDLAADSREQAAKQWAKHIENSPTNVKVLANAAAAFSDDDEPRAIELLERVVALEPKNPEWHERLGQLHAFAARSGEAIDPASAKKSSASYERALALSEPARRVYVLEEAAQAALLAGEVETAQKHANELIERAVQSPAGWNYGNAVHHGNLTLGHIALRAGKVDEAEEFLVRAGKTPGSPQLNSFGPNMRLALELLRKGRTQRVLEYLRLCQKFWNDPELNAWIKTVEGGGVPDFGANLDY